LKVVMKVEAMKI